MVSCKTQRRDMELKENITRGGDLLQTKIPNECLFCNQIVKNKYTLEVHLRRHTEEHPFSCTQCPKSFNSQEILTYHLQGHIGEIAKTHQCPLCDKRFWKGHQLQLHLKYHTRERPYKCSTCGKQCILERELKQHQKMHLDKSYQCIHCDSRFHNPENLASHVRKMHETINHCAICQVDITGLLAFHRHHQKFHPSRPRLLDNNCTFCGVDCKNKHNLQRHILVHIQEKPFHCKTCGAEFNLNKVKSDHQKNVHLNRLLKCDQCELTFRTNGAKLSHIKSIHKQVRFTCNVCQKEFTNNANCKAHIARVHTGELPFKCTRCDKSYAKRGQLNQHLKSHLEDNEKPHVCSICGKSFIRMAELKSHMELHNPKRTLLYCDICPASFKSRSGKASHILKAHSTQRECQSCVFCDQIFKDATALDNHIRRHIDEYFYVCKICGKQKTSKFSLSSHMMTHATDSEKKFECNICSKKYVMQCQLFNHLKIHTGEARKEYKCPECQIDFGTGSQLVSHLKESCGPKDADALKKYIGDNFGGSLFPCELCDKVFTRRYMLTTHMKGHRGELRYTCKICGKNYPSTSGYYNHRRTHLGEAGKKRECALCGKRFPDKSALSSHMLSHTGERTHECAMCGAKFKREYELKLHVKRLHVNDRKYSCSLCKSKFHHMSELRRHEDSMKSQKCTTCGMAFQCRQPYWRHVKTAHPVGSFGCVFCEKNFQRRRDLKLHINRHTGELPYSCRKCGKGFVARPYLNAHLNKKCRIHK